MSNNDVVTTNDIIQLYNYHLLLACNNNLVVQRFGRFDRYDQSVNIVFYPTVQPTNGFLPMCSWVAVPTVPTV